MAPPTIGGRSYGRSQKVKKTSASVRASQLSNRNGLCPHQHRSGFICQISGCAGNVYVFIVSLS